MIDILLISPHQPNTAKILRTASGITQPLPIAYIAAFLIQKGYKVSILDNDVENLSYEEISKKIIKLNPQSVGITINTSSTNTALEIAKIIKNTNNSITVIAGGIQATALSDIILKNEEIDICIIGEGEITTYELLNTIKNKTELSSVNGIAYKKENKIIFTKPRELIKNLDEIPFPSYELLPMNKYTLPASRRLTNYPVASIITSRGCPYQCKFCSHNIVFKNNVRFRSPENVINEMLYLRKKFGVREFVFWDDSILLNKERAQKLFILIKKELPDIYFSCSSRVDHINEYLAEIMYLAGCRMILFGAESGSQKILNSIKKQTTIEKIVKAVEICRKYKIKSFCSFIIGTPEETKKTIEETRKFVLKLEPDFAIFTIFTPLPGSDYFKEFYEKGLIKLKDLQWDKYINLLSSSEPAITITFKLTKTELINYQKKLFRDFYFRVSYIIKRAKMITNKQILYQTIRGVVAILKLQLKKFKL